MDETKPQCKRLVVRPQNWNILFILTKTQKQEDEKITDDPSHPCSKLLSVPNNWQYNLRTMSSNGSIAIFSVTERRKRSVLARACKYLQYAKIFYSFPKNINFASLHTKSFEQYTVFYNAFVILFNIVIFQHIPFHKHDDSKSIVFLSNLCMMD